jgi:prevent-host-death family protein
MNHTSVWQLQEAKSKFSELVESAVSKGAQVITRRGVETVVVLSMEEFNQLKKPREDLLSFFKNSPKIDLDSKRSKDKDRYIKL